MLGYVASTAVPYRTVPYHTMVALVAGRVAVVHIRTVHIISTLHTSHHTLYGNAPENAPRQPHPCYPVPLSPC
jgi:hypothetical protein